ncbi:Cu(I)-responsive transcriptional regulator [Halomonas sp. LBP4]|uniref:Cu(I)-responsive transcriptional regulator n=1 Tax=Halomonas sp. LBP4 TaxID=2044917 RepID=UPI000D770C15|nr:Cu(I)-responsive transcriptional regulator [Halomonas sp. LBP4]PXX95793.1 Cu(I)-responsive transcriptional regulator [Halomonas sp. LBP4]
MNIGDASRLSGVTAKMIRYYEAVGLIPVPLRGANDYRHYRPHDIHWLRFIRRARDLGFSLEQTRQLITLWQDHERSSAEVKRIATDHVAELNDKICQMAAMRETLVELAENCQGDHRPECPILRDLADDEMTATSRVS